MKEYDEGVDRMCKEVENAGLPDPTFNNNTFILKTVVMSSSYKNASIGTSIERNDASIYMSIERNDAMIDYKDALIEFIVQKEKATEISKKDAEDANKIVRELDLTT